MPVPHVLLVDDELAVLRVLDRALTRRGLRVSVAPDAATARAIVARETVHALVLDYRLPLIRGDALLAQLAEINPSLRRRAVFMTGDISPTVDATLAATGCACVAKPFELQDLAQRIDDLLAGTPTRAAAAIPAA
jgi:DNA-binding NtrC family response regulator